MTLKDMLKNTFIRPGDIIIIAILLLASFLPLVVLGSQTIDDEAVVKQAVLKVDNKVIKTFELKKDGPTYTYRYEDEDGDYNLIKVEGDQIRIIDANCGDLRCVRQGWISKPGQGPIACLPHNLFITIEASDGSEDGSLIY